MSRRFARLPCLMMLVALAAGSGQALARQSSRQAETRAQPAQAPRGSEATSDRRADPHALAAAVRRVERRTGGQVLSAERVPYEGRSLSRVKVVDATGRVRIYMDDPRREERRERPARPARASKAPPAGGRTRGDDD